MNLHILSIWSNFHLISGLEVHTHYQSLLYVTKECGVHMYHLQNSPSLKNCICVPFILPNIIFSAHVLPNSEPISIDEISLGS